MKRRDFLTKLGLVTAAPLLLSVPVLADTDTLYPKDGIFWVGLYETEIWDWRPQNYDCSVFFKA
jgi:hypothetical protein